MNTQYLCKRAALLVSCTWILAKQGYNLWSRGRLTALMRAESAHQQPKPAGFSKDFPFEYDMYAESQWGLVYISVVPLLLSFLYSELQTRDT
jgi:hypothetical protein